MGPKTPWDQTYFLGVRWRVLGQGSSDVVRALGLKRIDS
jgi:hypothetical protein